MSDEEIIQHIARLLDIGFRHGVFAVLAGKLDHVDDDDLEPGIDDWIKNHPNRLGISDDLYRDSVFVAFKMSLEMHRRGDLVATAAELAKDRISQGRPLPRYLADFAIGRLNGEDGRVKNPRYRDWQRDTVIASAVQWLESQGYKRTRNAATRSKPSACSIVADALVKIKAGNIGEDAIQKICNRIEDSNPVLAPWWAVLEK